MKILVIRFSSLGDLVTLEPMLRSIRYFYPEAEIDFYTSGIGKGLFAESGYFNECVVYRGFDNLLRLRKNSYDYVVNLQCTTLSHFLTAVIAPVKIVNQARSFWQKKLNIKVQSKKLPEILLALGVNPERVSEYVNESVNLMISLGMSGSNDKKADVSEKKHIVISTGASERWISKKWSLSSFNLLIKKIIGIGFKVTLVGTALEKEDAQFLCRENPGVIDLVGKTGIADLIKIISQADLFIGNDSGPVNIAAGTGVNTITLFGSTGEKHCVKHAAYYGTHLCIVPDPSIDCHPCYLTHCPKNHECMESISVDKVMQAVQSLL